MSKYGIVTYQSRKKTSNGNAQIEFDMALKAKDDEEKRINKKNVIHFDKASGANVKKKNRPTVMNNKRKLHDLLDDDLFGFRADDSHDYLHKSNENKISRRDASAVVKNLDIFKKKKSIDSHHDLEKCSSVNLDSPVKSSLKSPQKTALKNEVEKKVTFNVKEFENTKETEEWSDTNDDGGSKKQSPFKHFLKNNITSLSPKKSRLDRRFSALPTSMMEETIIDINCEDGKDARLLETSLNNGSTSRVRVNRDEKELFTVVQNVKHKQECLDDGETQQFLDDIQFSLDGLRKDLSMSARCLSALDVAKLCSTPAFRANLRAHGLVSKIFECLNDAPSKKSLALCLSCLFYVMTRDKLSVDFDQSILELLLKLLMGDRHGESCRDDEKKVSYEDIVRRTRQILTRLSHSHTMNLDLDDISSKLLAQEALLSLTTQRTGDWFRDEVRKLGGIDYINELVLMDVVAFKDKNEVNFSHYDKMFENVIRCLKFLENVTYQHQINQKHIVTYRKSSLIVTLSRLLTLCIDGILEERIGSDSCVLKIVMKCIKSILRLYLIVTHDNEEECTIIGEQNGLISTLMQCVFKISHFVSTEDEFDLLVLGLGLLINLMEHSKQNVARLIVLNVEVDFDSKKQISALEALVKVFLIREKAARNNETINNLFKDGRKDELKRTKDGSGWICGDEIDNTRCEDIEQQEKKMVAKSLDDEIGEVLKKAGEHMEDSMVASYIALLLGCIAKDNKANQLVICDLMPGNTFDLMINILKTFLVFMKLTSGTTGQAIENVINVLESC